jgi:hypothetical protein
MPKLEQWSVIDTRGPYDPPEWAQPSLTGTVTGHHRKSDGKSIVTSPIAGVENGVVRTKSGTLYELGEVDPEYEAKFPGARERLFKSYTQ